MSNKSILSNSSNVFVSTEQLAQARRKQQSEGNDCDMCAVFGTKGLIENGGQWIHCFQCNPALNNKPETKTLELSEAAQAAYIESPHTCPFCGSDELDANKSSITESGEVHQPVDCFDCSRSWTDVYVLQRIENIEDTA